MSYSAEERETVIVCDDVDRIWDVYTNQMLVINKLKKIGVEPYWSETETNDKGDTRITCAKYKLEYKQISMKKVFVPVEGRMYSFTKKVPNIVDSFGDLERRIDDDDEDDDVDVE